MFRRKPEYVLLHVRYAPDQKRIAVVRYVRYFGYFFSDWQLMNRDRLLQLLRQGKRAVVGWPGSEINDFRLGGKIRLVRVDGEEFIRTDGKAEAQDRLDGLPIF